LGLPNISGINGVDATDIIYIENVIQAMGIPFSYTSVDYTNGTLTVSGQHLDDLTFSYSVPVSGDLAGDTFVFVQGGGPQAQPVTCFRSGTRIAVPDGERRVEDLQVGDLIRTVSGRMRPIAWIGRRSVDLSDTTILDKVSPVRIAANAFGPGCPVRTLFLSPDHAVYVDDVLIPVKHLINGSSIRQVFDGSIVQYFHIELDSHDVTFADGLPVETYLEIGQRALFENGLEPVKQRPIVPGLDWEANAYAALIVTGPILDAVRRRLAGSLARRRKPKLRKAA
jgi:hypothetical protein